jgi:hypothetical protein
MATWQLVSIIGKGGVGFFWHPMNMDLKDILPEFQKLLRERRMILRKSIPYYAVWVSKFPIVVNRNGPCPAEPARRPHA